MSVKIDPNTLIDPKFIRIPYVLGGKDFSGADCIGVAILYMRSIGIDYEYDDGMGPIMSHWWEHNPRRFLDAFLSMGTIVRFPQLKKHDCLLLFGAEQSTFPSCVGIMVDDRHFLMAMPERGSFVSMLNLHWKNKMFSAIRLHKITEKFGP